MSAPRDSTPEETLRGMRALADAEIDLAEAALALARLDRPRVSAGRYREHLARLRADARDARGAAATTPSAAECAAILAHVVYELNGYAGDELTYEDPQNANLMRVIDRRKGLPVALGILYIHAARGIGCAAEGLNFPGHFVVRIEGAGGRVIVDPFDQGRTLEAAGLRALVKSLVGPRAELEPRHTEPVGNRDILLRLQNNLKLRLLRHGEIEHALAVVDRMLLFAPDVPELWREAGTMHARLDNPRAAIDALEQFVRRSPHDRTRYQTSMLIQELKNRLN